MKPIIILPPYNMSEQDIAMLREAGAVVVVSNDPDAVKVSDLSVDKFAAAALEIVTSISRHTNAESYWSAQVIGKWFAKLILKDQP